MLCVKGNLHHDVRFPEEVLFGNDLWVTGVLMVKAVSISLVNECLYNYSRQNPEADTLNMNSLKRYWQTMTRIHNKQLLKQAGLPDLDSSNREILNDAVNALILNGRDGLLKAEQVTELSTIVANIEKTVEQMDALSKYKVYHILFRYAKGMGDYGRALTYAWYYVLGKARYLLGK